MKLKQKLMAAILTVMMLTSYVAILTDAVIAAGINLAQQNSKTNHTNVEFNSYFEEEAHSKTFEMEEAKLYLKFKVSNTGYLKNGVVQFLNANFEVNSNSLKHDKVQSSSKDTIYFKQINNGEEVIVEVPITMLKEEKVDNDFFNKMVTTRFTATYMDENGKEKNIEKEISNELSWTGNAEVELAGEVTKYLPYQVENEKGVMVQAKVRSGLKENNLPVNQTKLEVSLPEITIAEDKNIKPERITVIANSTAGTNGKGSYEFNEGNYQYNEETGKIEITVENKEEDGKIAWNKKAVDEYIVNFIFTGEEVYNYVYNQLENAQAITGQIEVKAEIEPYHNEKTVLTQSGKIVYNIEKAKGELIDSTISTISKMSKGYIYANYAKTEKEEKKDTSYTVNYTAQVQDKTLTNGIEFQIATEKYIDQNENEYSSRLNQKDGVYSKTIIISEAMFTKMLGEEGKIEILNKAGEQLAEVTKAIEKDSNGNYVIDITEAKTNEIIIKTSKPVTEGNIEIAVEKAIVANQEYSKEEMQAFQKMILGLTTKSDNTVIEKQTQMNLIEPVSKAEISIGTQRLSTIVENKDVEFRVVLDTSSNENALYKNPTFQIILPENIETLNIKSSDILLDDELKIKETKVVEQNGRKVILITLTGTQTKYMDNDTSNKEEQSNVISKGANIVIKADITFKKLTPSANSNIYLYYTNENTTLFEKYYQKSKTRSMTTDVMPTGMATTEVEIVSPNGVIAENHMSGFKANGNISNSSGERQTQNIDAHGEAKEVTIGGTIVNNYENSIENVVILGRIPFSGNKAIDATQELGSNFTMAIKDKLTTSGIDNSKVRVYYSTNGEANKNLMDTNNNWVEEPTNLAEIKSYLIMISGELARGTQFSFDYKVQLPANLKYNQEAYSNYKVYYDNKMADATLGETKVAGIIGLTTGQGPELQVNVTSNSNTVREGQIIRMTATVKNIGGLTAKNARLVVTAPEGTIHTEIKEGSINYEESEDAEKIIVLGDISQGETTTVNYELKIKKGKKIVESTDADGNVHRFELSEYPGDKDISITAKIVADNLSNGITSNNCTVRVLEGDLSIITTPRSVDTRVIKMGDTVKYKIAVENNSNNKNLDNVKVNIKFPKGFTITDCYYDKTALFLEKKRDNITKNANNATVSLAYLHNANNLEEEHNDIQERMYILVEAKMEELSEEHDIIVNGVADGIETHYSNIRTITTGAINLKFEQKELNNQYIKEGSNYTYQFVLENIGEIVSRSNKMEMPIPEGLSLQKAEYIEKGKTKTKSVTKDGKVIIDILELNPEEKVEIFITVKANLLPDKNDKEIITMATLTAEGINPIESNKVKAIIEYDEEAHKEEQGGTNEPSNPTGRYKITGTAWIDANRDGKRDDTEEVLSNVQVVLLYKSNSQIVKDEITGAEKITTTNSSGKYEFSNLKPDEYLVLFLYDAGKYSITDYKKEGVAESVNSDATSMKIVLNGEQRQAGVSNTIKITNNNVRDIDIGLFVAEKFDLRLDKYISKVTTTTPSNGTKTYNYNNSKITKREIAGKDVGNSSLVVEYKIVATNEGQVEGYVKKIIDYLPDGAKFSSELNKDWYIADNNGAVYNTALENEKLAPGESKEVRLVLSFTINNKSIGKMINNNAEIYESYNELGLEDIDSIAANRLESEDDMSSADIIVSVATGRIIIYTTFALAVIALLGFGVFEIKKHVLNRKD
ncbi:MAG: hypothetical protein HFJ30_03320 [Clostridia bacterium]|jgi:uncharacterized repeat protein (TIGR01451 family)|nr:hypothetical protein [Clostridia bacterium]MCI9413317.1 hypothetical protein [Clostridia bacterium]